MSLSSTELSFMPVDKRMAAIKREFANKIDQDDLECLLAVYKDNWIPPQCKNVQLATRIVLDQAELAPIHFAIDMQDCAYLEELIASCVERHDLPDFFRSNGLLSPSMYYDILYKYDSEMVIRLLQIFDKYDQLRQAIPCDDPDLIYRLVVAAHKSKDVYNYVASIHGNWFIRLNGNKQTLSYEEAISNKVRVYLDEYGEHSLDEIRDNLREVVDGTYSSDNLPSRDPITNVECMRAHLCN